MPHEDQIGLAALQETPPTGLTQGLVAPSNNLDLRFWRKVLGRAKECEVKEKKQWGKYTELYRDGQFGNKGDPNARAGVGVNHTFSHVETVSALMFVHDPAMHIKPRMASGHNDQAFQLLVQIGQIRDVREARRLFAATLLKLMRYTYTENNYKIHNEACLFEAIVRGLGITKTSLDASRRLPRIDALRRHEVYFDPNARYSPHQGAYVIHTPQMSIEEARTFFGAKGIPEQEIQPNFNLGDSKDPMDKARADHAGSSESEDLFKFHEIWQRGLNGPPQLTYWGINKSAPMLDPEPWPFFLDQDEFPFETLSFHKQFGRVADAFTGLHVVEALRQTFEDMFEAYHRQARRTVAKKVLFDERKFTPDKIEALQNTKEMEWVGVKVDADKRLQDGIWVQDFNTPSDAAIELAHNAEDQRNKVSGLDELVRNAPTRGMSATEAAVRDENSKVRANKMQSHLDDFIVRQLRHSVQVARQLVDGQTVAKIAGQVGALTWELHAGDQEDIISEYSITIQAGSTGERAKREKLERLALQFEQGQAINQASGGLPIVDLPGISTAMNEVSGDTEPDRFINQQFAEFVNSGQLFMAQTQAEEEANGEEGQSEEGAA